MSARRWIQDHPRPLEWAYRHTERLLGFLEPLFVRLGYERVGRLILPLERVSKELVFDCRMCGQCILRQTGMTCPMTCPKLLRNGPCGGVRPGGFCEVYPGRRCIWTDAFQRTRNMPLYGQDILLAQPLVDWRLTGTSAWINILIGTDPPQAGSRRCPGVPEDGSEHN
jgi:hypothetical protein